MKNQTEEKDDLICGIIMPITPAQGYHPMHWNQIRSLIEESIAEIKDYNFKSRMVSESDKISVIHKTIIQNIYNDHMVVCDVSTKNPNVMFELGMRLAFNKPVVIIKDLETEYVFDTATIRHITYPKTLNYFDIKEFKEKLKNYIIEGYKDVVENKFDFLKEYGELKAETLEESKINLVDIYEQVAELKREMKKNHINNNNNRLSLNEEICRRMNIYEKRGLAFEEALEDIAQRYRISENEVKDIYYNRNNFNDMREQKKLIAEE